MANVPPPRNRRKHALTSSIIDSLELADYCSRRDEYVYPDDCLRCFQSHAQLQMTFRLRTHCTDTHLLPF